MSPDDLFVSSCSRFCSSISVNSKHVQGSFYFLDQTSSGLTFFPVTYSSHSPVAELTGMVCTKLFSLLTSHSLTLIPLSKSVPRLLAQVLYLGTQIVGKAFAEAGRQAVRSKSLKAIRPSLLTKGNP